MLSNEQYRDGILFKKYAQDHYSPDIQARVKKIEDASMFLLDLPLDDERMDEMIKLSSQFYTRLKMDLETSGFAGLTDASMSPQDILLNTAMYNFLVGSSDNLKRWQSMGFDLHKPGTQYQYSQPETIGLLEASYYYNAQSLGVEIDTSRITPEIAALFKTVNGILIPSEPEV